MNTLVSFSEIPDEISLCLSISNCPCKCKGCHSSYLAGNIGKVLNWESLNKLIKKNKGITCICFMGGDNSPREINTLAETVNFEHPGLRVGWYSGRQELAKEIDLVNFDFIKLGPYEEDKGPLNNPNTNQKFYHVVQMSTGKFKLIDVTYLFWKK